MNADDLQMVQVVSQSSKVKILSLSCTYYVVVCIRKNQQTALLVKNIVFANWKATASAFFHHLELEKDERFERE